MPLLKGKSKKVMDQNFHELHQGPQYAKTKRKFGKAKADKQAVAIVLGLTRKDPRRVKYW